MSPEKRSTISLPRLIKRECDSYQLRLVLAWSPGVAVGVQEHLGVGMDGDKGLEVTVGLHKVHNGLDLRLRVSSGSMVGL